MFRQDMAAGGPTSFTRGLEISVLGRIETFLFNTGLIRDASDLKKANLPDVEVGARIARSLNRAP